MRKAVCMRRKAQIHRKKKIIHTRKRRAGIYEAYVKRPLDAALSASALIVLSPLMLFLSAAVRCKLGTPVIFRQKRVGKDEKIFEMYKFRSMTNARDGEGNLLPDDARLTPFGRKLRASSLDELPELFNILKGDMSIVGPRPLLVEYLPYYTKEERHRHDVRPGLTGLAQVNGRSFLSWEDIFEYDLRYVSKVSFWKDLKIILKTAAKVLAKSDVADVTQATLESDGKLHIFTGENSTPLHQPMNVERGRNHAERDRK